MFQNTKHCTTYLAENGCVRVGQCRQQVLCADEAVGQAVHAEAARVQHGEGERAHLGPMHIKHARAKLLAQKLRLGARRRVLLHVLHKAIALGVARDRTVHQKAALQVAKGPHEFLELLLAEGAWQVGDAQQRVCGLQLHGDLALAQHMLVELADSMLGLLAIQQGDESCGKNKDGDKETFFTDDKSVTYKP